MVACQECLDQLQNVDTFAMRCVSANKLFLELFNGVSRDKGVPLGPIYDLNGEQSQSEALQSFDPKTEDPGVEYLEIEYIQELLPPEQEELDAECISSVKSEESYMKGATATDNVDNMEILADMENIYDSNNIIYEEVDASNMNFEMDKSIDVIYEEEVLSSGYVNFEMDNVNNIIYEEDSERDDNYRDDVSNEVNEEDVPFSYDELDNINMQVELNDVKNKQTPNKRSSSKLPSTGYICTLCNTKFSRPKWFEKHMITKHSQNGGPVEYACEMCPKRFAHAYILKEHQIVHLPDDQKPIYQCMQCIMTFKSRESLRKHIKGIHDRDGQVICDECGKVFQQKGALNTHKIVHATERPCHCTKCPKTFKDITHLRKHMDVHNEDIHECSHCGKRLKTKRVLRDHMVVHFGEKKFKCQICELIFKRKNTLRVS